MMRVSGRHVFGGGASTSRDGGPVGGGGAGTASGSVPAIGVGGAADGGGRLLRGSGSGVSALEELVGGDNRALPSSAADTGRKREKTHLVLGFFLDGALLWSQNSRYRQAFCLLCEEATGAKEPIRGRMDLMCKHILGCRHVPRDHKAMTAARAGAHVARKHLKSSKGSGAASSEAATVGPMNAHVARPFSARMTRELEQELLGVLLYCSIAFSILDSPPFCAFLKKWVAGMKAVPSRRSMSNTVLERVLSSLVAISTAAYAKGVYVALSFDGWKSRGGRKILGMLASWVGQADGAPGMDFRGTTDITSTAETAARFQAEIERELQAAAQDNDFLLPLPSGLPNDLCRSTVIGFVSDWASSNGGAKQAISRLHQCLMMVACYAHQLNLVTGFVANHPSMRSAASKMRMVVKFFSLSTKWMAKLEVCMDECNGPRLAFVKRGETRWYSHFGMVRRILELRGALVALGHKHNDDGYLLGTNQGAEVVDLLRSRLISHMAEAMSRMLRPVVIEIGLVERRGSGLADVCASFGRLYAYFL